MVCTVVFTIMYFFFFCHIWVVMVCVEGLAEPSLSAH